MRGIEKVIAIDEVVSRLPHSEESHTFHGRDVYAYNGARYRSSNDSLNHSLTVLLKVILNKV